MTSKTRIRLKVGVVGLGRLGKVYVRDLAARIPETTVVAVADTDRALAEQIAEEFERAEGLWLRRRADRRPPTSMPSSSSPRRTRIGRSSSPPLSPANRRSARNRRRSVSPNARRCRTPSTKSGTFFQMGFMRRFDPGYAAAKEKIAQGAIGRPVVFKSTSRDPFRPSLEYANPASSGGIMVDMGIHDFDLARWFMGDVDTVSAAGAVLAYPEMASIGDIDNAIATLVFADGRLGVIDLTRNGVYGYDISTELLGTPARSASATSARRRSLR